MADNQNETDNTKKLIYQKIPRKYLLEAGENTENKIEQMLMIPQQIVIQKLVLEIRI